MNQKEEALLESILKELIAIRALLSDMQQRAAFISSRADEVRQ